jgi:hypothetical protein
VAAPSTHPAEALKEGARPTTALRTLTGSQILWDALEEQGVEVVFGYPGGAIMPAYDALPGSRIRHVLVRHEQGAAHMADAHMIARAERQQFRKRNALRPTPQVDRSQHPAGRFDHAVSPSTDLRATALNIGNFLERPGHGIFPAESFASTTEDAETTE